MLIWCRSDEDGFSRAFVMKLIEQLEMEPLPHLTPNEHAHLLVLIQTTLEVNIIVAQPHFFFSLNDVCRSTNSAVH